MGLSFRKLVYEIFLPPDLINLGYNAGKGIAQKVPDLIPSPAKIMTLSKNALLGLPFEALLSVLDQLCEYQILIVFECIE